MRFGIGVSKSIRNAGKPLVPIWLREAMVESAKNSAKGKIIKSIAEHDKLHAADPQKHPLNGRDHIIDQLCTKLENLYGIEYDDMVRRANGVHKKDWNVEIITRFASDLKNLMTGQMKIEEIYGMPDDDDAAAGQHRDKVPNGATAGDPQDHQDHPGRDDKKKRRRGDAKAGAGDKTDDKSKSQGSDPGPATDNPAAMGIRQQIIDAAKKKNLPGGPFNAWLGEVFTFTPLDKVPDSMLTEVLTKVKKLSKEQCEKIAQGQGVL
jgi:hypothetical protein